MINEDNFAERLSQLREAKQVSAREMSLSIGQNCSYINRIENKKAFPSMQCFSTYVTISRSVHRNFLMINPKLPTHSKSYWRLQKLYHPDNWNWLLILFQNSKKGNQHISFLHPTILPGLINTVLQMSDKQICS